MVKIHILIGADKFEIEAEAVFADAKSLIEQWFTERHADQQARIDVLTSKLAAEKGRLISAADTPPIYNS